MKKFATFFLALVMLVMLLPMSPVAKAERIGDVPFYCVNMSGTTTEIPYVYSMPFFWSFPVDKNTEHARVSWGDAETPVDNAVLLKEEFNSRPDGTRYFQLTLLRTGFVGKVEKVIFFDKGVEFVKEWVVEFLEEYKKIGGKLDGIIVDLEYIHADAYYIQDIYLNGNRNVYKDIVNDSRYTNDVKPRLKALGFDFSLEGTNDTELWSIQSRTANGTNPKYNAKNASIWNHVTTQMQREAINEAVLYPLLEYYPDATVSDYQSGTYDVWQKAVGLHGGFETNYNITGAGNLANQGSYAGRPSTTYVNNSNAKTPPSYNGAYYKASPFGSTQYDVNLFKTMYASTDDGKIDAWIAHYWFGKTAKTYATPYTETPYYTENMLHIGLLDPKPFDGYIIKAEVEEIGHTLDEACWIVSDIMAELTRVAGTSDRKPIQTPASWNGSYILSGMYAGGRNIWRLTPDTSVVSLENFKVAGEDPTFKIDGLTITFPGGKIIENGNIRQAGSCGYWIETPKNVNPVITGTADRYREYPSFGEDFEGYNVGSSFTGTSAKPKNSWTVSGTAKIRENGNGKALALSGTTTVKNVKLPQNITAGDDYAKQQAWEVTVTLPEGLNSSAEINLLSCASGDLGVKIADGKLYYDRSGSYQQLSGVDLRAGTYTIKREVDFRTAGSYTSSYSIYDASGVLLSEVKDVPMKSFTLPVTTITIKTTSLNGAVFIDDYKLYPTGVTTVFETYDAEIGTKLDNTNTARTEDTAYRLSWLNATSEPMTAYIYDSISGNVIETVGITPGMDGVSTGVVKVAAGDSVKLAVRTEAGELLPPGPEGEGDEPSGGNTGEGTEVTEPSGTTGADEPSGGLDVTEPSGTGDATEPSVDTDPGVQEPDDKLGAGVIVLIVILSLAILGGGGFAVYWFIIKPKLAAKAVIESVLPEDMPEQTDTETE